MLPDEKSFKVLPYMFEMKTDYSPYRIDSKSGVLNQFIIEFCIHVGFYIIINLFLSWVKSGFDIRSNEYRIV